MLVLTGKHHLPPPLVALLLRGGLHPDKNDFNNPIGNIGQMVKLHQFVGSRLRNEGFHVVRTLPLFKKYSGQALAVSEWDSHPNYLAHYIYARSIFDYLIQKKLISHKG